MQLHDHRSRKIRDTMQESWETCHEKPRAEYAGVDTSSRFRALKAASAASYAFSVGTLHVQLPRNKESLIGCGQQSRQSSSAIRMDRNRSLTMPKTSRSNRVFANNSKVSELRTLQCVYRSGFPHNLLTAGAEHRRKGRN